MKIECPHCTQSIDLGDDPPPSFSCPTCEGDIQLQVKAEAVKPPAPVPAPAGKGIKPAVLIGCVAGAVVLSLLLGWMIWGGSNSKPELPLSERIIGTWHEQTDQPGAMYYKFYDDGDFEWGGYMPEHGDKGYGIMLRGRYKTSEEDLLQIQQFQPNTGVPRGEWIIQKITMKGDVLTVHPAEGMTRTFTYERASTATKKNEIGEPRSQKKTSQSSMLKGEWKTSGSLSADEMRTAAPEMPNGVRISIEITGSSNFQDDGSFFKSRRVKMEMSGPGGELTLLMVVNESGEWSIEDGVLSEKALDGVLVPQDDFTRTAVRNNPEMAGAFRLVKGQITTFKILSMTESEVRILDKDLNGMILTLKREL